MARNQNKDELEFGSDSFLDIVANIVGILIILVVVVGVRVKQSPAETEPQPTEPLPDLAAAQQQVADLEGAVADLSSAANDARQQQQDLESQLAIAAERLTDSRVRLQQSQSESQQALARQQLQQQELAAALAASQRELDGLAGRLASLAGARGDTVQIESYPTPLSQQVRGAEVHFQLLGGRLTYVPFQELVDRMLADGRAKLKHLDSSRSLEAKVGPVRGFDLQYTMVRSARGAGIAKITFIPQSKQLGETLAEAMSADSQFRRMMPAFDPKTTTVTLWTYPDSFAEYRQIKKELYLLGFPVAGRPLPFGQLITGSPNGSRSAAQ